MATGLVAEATRQTPAIGERVARPPFNALQNYGSGPAPVIYYVFDVMVLGGRDVMREPLEKRRELLEQKVPPKLSEPVR